MTNLSKKAFCVETSSGGVWDVNAVSDDEAIEEIARDIYDGDKTGLTARLAPKIFMIYENGEMRSAFEGLTADEAIATFLRIFRGGNPGGSIFTADEINDAPEDGDDGLG
jgi:hypothetical protein